MDGLLSAQELRETAWRWQSRPRHTSTAVVNEMFQTETHRPESHRRIARFVAGATWRIGALQLPNLVVTSGVGQPDFAMASN
jgi:hypothetical protein